MFSVLNQLNPAKEYSFQTSPSGRTHPMRVKQFLICSHGEEKLITVDNGLGAFSKRLWSIYDGWNANEYKMLVMRFIAFIDKSQMVGQEFIDCAIRDSLSVNDAVESWFNGSELTIELEHHAEGSTGFVDIDIKGINSVRRVVLDMDIKNGDMFNIYYGVSSKGGGTWDTDLKTTLEKYFSALC